jgi:5-methyltetrahydropteroyltriglutamate--homocysteine methyltransferase
MKRSTERILTTHCGSLPRAPEVLTMLEEALAGRAPDRARFDVAVREGVADVVGRQVAAGVDVVNDGEMSKQSFMGYYLERLGGLTMTEIDATDAEPVRGPSAETKDYPGYAERWGLPPGRAAVQRQAGGGVPRVVAPVATGPVTYTGTSALRRDIDSVLAAARSAGATDVFMTAVPPGGTRFGFGAVSANQYYPTQEELEEAVCEAMRVEYEAIVGAGIVLQMDCNWGALSRLAAYSTEDVRRMITHGIELMNHATRNIDPDMMRIHLCWGADEAPHHKDLPLDAIVDLMLTARPAGLGVVAANGRHEWEWRVWKDVKVPDGKVIIPGVIDSTTNIIEHPETVAERIRRFADVLGRENILAGVDCGLDTVAGSAQVVPEIAWAKLASLAEGARLADSALY